MNSASQVQKDYKLASCWSFSESINYFRDFIDPNVDKLSPMVQNITKPPRAVSDDKNLPPHRLSSDKRRKWGRSCGAFSSMVEQMDNSLMVSPFELACDQNNVLRRCTVPPNRTSTTAQYGLHRMV